MTLKNSKSLLFNFLFAYLVNLGFACYFSKGVKTLYPSYLLVLILALGGLAIGGALSFLFVKKEEAKSGCTIYAIFQLIQGLLGFGLAYYLFHLPLKGSFVFPIATLINLLIWFFLSVELSVSLASILLSVFIAIGLSVVLRLNGVWGGLFYSLLLLNSFSFGFKNTNCSESKQMLFFKALCFGSMLAVGRGVIQYYLLQTNYDSLGVVITHPYTFVALFVGVFIPVIFWVMQKENAMNVYLQIILFGLFLPFLLGVFLHVRPFAGYLLGLVISSFMIGLLFVESDFFQSIVYGNFAVAIFSIPIFQKMSYLNRSNRIGLLAIFFAVFIVVYLFIKLFQRKNETLQTT